MVDSGDIEDGIASIVDTGGMVRDVYGVKEVNMYWIKIKDSNDISQWELRYTDLEFTDNSYDVTSLIAEILEHSYKEAHISIEYEEDF